MNHYNKPGQVVCGSCTACCRWGANASVLQPILGELEAGNYQSVEIAGSHRLAATPSGDCVYLGHRGCTIHPTRPQFCRRFDCREAYDSIINNHKSNTLLQVLIQGGIRRNET